MLDKAHATPDKVRPELKLEDDDPEKNSKQTEYDTQEAQTITYIR